MKHLNSPPLLADNNAFFRIIGPDSDPCVESTANQKPAGFVSSGVESMTGPNIGRLVGLQVDRPSLPICCH